MNLSGWRMYGIRVGGNHRHTNDETTMQIGALAETIKMVKVNIVQVNLDSLEHCSSESRFT